jgi:hypothetical protein
MAWLSSAGTAEEGIDAAGIVQQPAASNMIANILITSNQPLVRLRPAAIVPACQREGYRDKPRFIHGRCPPRQVRQDSHAAPAA